MAEIAALSCKTEQEIEQARVRLLGKKGEITALFDEFRTVAPELKREFGQKLNVLKNTAAAKIEELKEAAAESPAAGAASFDSATSFGVIRGGHVNVTFLGALEVDEKGDLANWMIPGKKTPGMGGAMDLLVGAKKVILTMEHTAKGNHKILKQCRLPLTAAGQVNMIITEMGVMEITPKGIVLTEINPEFTVEQIQEATEATLIISENLKQVNLN